MCLLHFFCLIQSNYENICNKSICIHSSKWQKVTKNNQNYHMTKNLCTHTLSTLLRLTTGLVWYAGTHLWSMSILSSLASSPSSLRTSKPLNSASPSGPRPCPTWYIWRTSLFGFGGFGTQKHRGRYEDLLTMYFYITLSLSKVEIMKWEHCWTGKELSAF